MVDHLSIVEKSFVYLNTFCLKTEKNRKKKNWCLDNFLLIDKSDFYQLQFSLLLQQKFLIAVCVEVVKLVLLKLIWLKQI